MPLSEHERHVLLFKLHVGMVPEDAPTQSMTEAVEMLQEVFAAGNASMLIGEHVEDAEEEGEDAGEIAEGTNIILIRRMEVDAGGIASILLHHGDATAADPALMQIKNGAIRKAGKTADEGVAHAAHLVISAHKHKSAAGQSYALLERVPNLGRGTVIAFLNRLLRLHAKAIELRYTDEETGKTLRCHPKFRSLQQLSHGLKADLQKGKLSRIEFIKHDVVGGFEEPNTVVPVSQHIVHKVVNAPSGNKALDLIERAKVFARKANFDEMQIRFRKSDTDQQLSPRFATDLADAQDAIYSRFEVLKKFKKPLEQCPQEAVADLRDKMVALFERKELWK